MQAFLDLEVREQLAKCLTGKTSLDDFRTWLAPITMVVEQSGNVNAVQVVHDIELAMAEFTSGHWTEAQLHDLLRPFVQDYEVDIELTESGARPTSRPAPAMTGTNVTVGEVGSWSSVGRALVAAFA
jgi:hypothetical protein